MQTIIPETGNDAIDWINDVDDAGGPFFVGAWFIILGGFLGLLALIGFWEALRDAGRLLILARRSSPSSRSRSSRSPT